MAEELFYTSAQRGLRPGTRGFCTVAYTHGLSPIAIRLLEALSAYKGAYAVHDPRAAAGNPVAYSHYRTTIVGRNINILSRVGDSGADHTNRTNKIAHHVVLSSRERPSGGPAWLASHAGFLQDTWSGEPRELETPKSVPEGDSAGLRAATWEAVTGDAGWAGALAQAFISHPLVPSFIVFEPGMNTLALIAEALALIEPQKRWQVTFNTYFTSLPAGLGCNWRCCLPGADCLREARRNSRALLIDLTNLAGEPPESPYVRCAREGGKPAVVKETSGAGAFVMLPNRRQKVLRMHPAKRAENENDNAT